MFCFWHSPPPPSAGVEVHPQGQIKVKLTVNTFVVNVHIIWLLQVISCSLSLVLIMLHLYMN